MGVGAAGGVSVPAAAHEGLVSLSFAHRPGPGGGQPRVPAPVVGAELPLLHHRVRGPSLAQHRQPDTTVGR